MTIDRRGAMMGLGMAVAAALGVPLAGAVARMAEAERDAAVLAAEAHAALPPPVAGRIGAPDAAQASARVAARVRQAAAGGGVLVERLTAGEAASPGVATLALSASGSEPAVLALAETIERGEPRLRWRRWSLAALPEGNVRLTGEVLVPWR